MDDKLDSAVRGERGYVSGYVDLTQISSEASPSKSPGSIRLPGLDISWGDGPVQALCEGELVVVSMGSPRFDADARAGQRPTASSAAAWRALYVQYGARCVERVGGSFAVILIDLDARRVLAATDRFGIYPLCYSFVDGVFSFSDRADSVPRHSGREIDPQALLEYFYFHVVPAPRTVFKGVYRLDLGHSVTVTVDGVIVRRYWRPSFSENANTSLPELKERFRQLLESAVAQELSGERVGAFLSGGTDSSTVAGMIAKITGAPVRTFSIGFEAQGYDEMEYARIAARHFGAEHNEYYVTPSDLLESIPAVAQHYDQPFGNSSAPAAYCCARTAKDAGVDKLLAGDGGDELFGGNERYAKQRVFEAYHRLPSILRECVAEPILGAHIAHRLPLIRKAASYVDQARVPMPARLNAYNLLLRLGLNNVLDPALLARIDAQGPAVQESAIYGDCDAKSLINRILAFDWKYTLADNDLPKVRETSGLAGVNVGFPLLSDALVDFSLGLAPELKVRGLQLRWFFKEALRDFLPQEIIRKKKHGFGLPYGVWLVRHRDLFEFSAEAARALARRAIVRASFVEQLLGAKLRDHPAYYGEMIWIMVMLEYWLRKHSADFALS